VKISRDIVVNREIKAREVRVIDDSGEMLGVMSVEDGVTKAKDKGLDLILVSPNAEPPVCKIMEYGQYKYEHARKLKGARKGLKSGIVKELKMSPVIGEHDFQVRLRQTEDFLKKGYKVKVNIVFKGRANTHPEVGYALMDRYLITARQWGEPEEAPIKIGRNIIVIMNPHAGPKKKEPANA
jgi:translation initiation factor IF-3